MGETPMLRSDGGEGAAFFQTGGDVFPVEVLEDCVDVGGAVGAEIVEVGVAVEVDGQEREGVPDGEGLAGAAGVIEEVVVVDVVGGPGPAAGGEGGLAEVMHEGGEGAEVAFDEIEQFARGGGGFVVEGSKEEFVVFDGREGVGEIDLEGLDVGIAELADVGLHFGKSGGELIVLGDVADIESVVVLEVGFGEARKRVGRGKGLGLDGIHVGSL